MQVVGDPNAQVPILTAMQVVIDKAEERPVEIEALDCFAFYNEAQASFPVGRTSDPGP